MFWEDFCADLTCRSRFFSFFFFENVVCLEMKFAAKFGESHVEIYFSGKEDLLGANNNSHDKATCN